jgi:1,4-alpha-glucan branching enzyme
MTTDVRSAFGTHRLHPDMRRLLEGRLHDPRSVLGCHAVGDRTRLRVALPHAHSARLARSNVPLTRIEETYVFECTLERGALVHPVAVLWIDDAGHAHETYDPYSFPLQISSRELADFGHGHSCRAYRFLGSHVATLDGVQGMRFAVWAPDAERVSVVGDFNGWDGRAHPMIVRDASGVWELFVPGIAAGVHYKYEIRNRASGRLLVKSDPYAGRFELRPATASITPSADAFDWNDDQWIHERQRKRWRSEPISVYELHLGSWRRGAAGEFLNYRSIARELVEHVSRLGFTHVELMPITEHPFDDSWGYQTTGFFAPTSRFGDPNDFRAFVDYLHQHGIGVILDWVPGHFPKDVHALAEFDGSKLYEYADWQKGEHPDWQTLVFNYSRNEVRSFLFSSAVYWLEEFHIDGLRVDAVASMLYLDYSREHGRWTPNVHGGNENLEAIDFLKRLNEITHGECPGTFTVAEESTAWPKVSRPTFEGGLGFSFKWNMGWMHDTLLYMKKDPVHRCYHHDLLTFGPMYAFTEHFMLPLSHDEVVHGKGSLLGRMPGDHWQRFANLRLLYTFQWTYPGKKLLFMGGELAQPWEWDHHASVPWHLLGDAGHAGITALLADLNRLYRERRALQHDSESDCFYWLSWEDRASSVLSFARRDGDSHLLVVLNFTPVARDAYRIGVPFAGTYVELLNSDSRFYGGSDFGNALPLSSEPIPHMGQGQSVTMRLPPLGGVILTLRGPGG